jgi:hypothetical protein
VDGSGLGVVQHKEVENERQGGCIPQLKQGPDQRYEKENFLGIAPVGLRAPDSVSATNSWASALDAGFFFGSAMVTIPPYQAMVTSTMQPFAAAIPLIANRHATGWSGNAVLPPVCVRAFIQLLRNVDNTTARSNLKTVRRPYLGLVRSNDGRL